ncbi:unnamed protein product [Medioppia subpectinata]|uniref:Uncharacterized protein n=1 Tax=Medioppia subpectinata TaxID=1979941 RepID=A0A7R9KKN1_9ACAR|nr:unnamed protein product [Medioppia subpectinata]CAG2104096.1 unnamed protein product [Medioppia subpectinata]
MDIGIIATNSPESSASAVQSQNVAVLPKKLNDSQNNDNNFYFYPAFNLFGGHVVQHIIAQIIGIIVEKLVHYFINILRIHVKTHTFFGSTATFCDCTALALDSGELVALVGKSVKYMHVNCAIPLPYPHEFTGVWIGLFFGSTATFCDCTALALDSGELVALVEYADKYSFCVHADKRKMLQSLTNMLQDMPQKAFVLHELSSTIASAVNASHWNLFLTDWMSHNGEQT